MVILFIIFAAALFVDGATDCANCVTGAVSSGTLSLRSASLLSAILSFFGCAVFCIFFPFVAESVSSAVSFSKERAIVAIAVSLLTVAVWSGIGWLFSLPTSEGHSLVSASAGAALALGGEIRAGEIGLILLSVVPSALFSAVLSAFFARWLKNARKKSCRIPIIVSAAAASFFHGAQDGQKFMALALSASLISESSRVPFVIFGAVCMGIGTLFGGRIVRKMGGEMAVADERGALGADMGAALALSVLTALGIPSSTTHIRMSALAAGAAASGGRTDKGTFLLTVTAWAATFPVSFALSFLLSKVILTVFL